MQNTYKCLQQLHNLYRQKIKITFTWLLRVCVIFLLPPIAACCSFILGELLVYPVIPKSTLLKTRLTGHERLAMARDRGVNRPRTNCYMLFFLPFHPSEGHFTWTSRVQTLSRFGRCTRAPRKQVSNDSPRKRGDSGCPFTTPNVWVPALYMCLVVHT